MQLTYVHRRTSCYYWFGWNYNMGAFFTGCQGLFPRHSGVKGVSSRILLVPSWSKKQVTTTFTYFWCLDYGNYVSHELPPCAASSTWTWVNQPLALVQWLAGCRTTTYYYFKLLGVTWDIYWRNCYYIVKKYWAALGLLFWKRSVSPSSPGVSWCSFCLFLVVFFLCFVVCLADTWFLLSPILQHVGIAYQIQNVLMTVWASSEHGMSSKKSPLAMRCCFNKSHRGYMVPHMLGTWYLIRISWRSWPTPFSSCQSPSWRCLATQWVDCSDPISNWFIATIVTMSAPMDQKRTFHYESTHIESFYYETTESLAEWHISSYFIR